LRPVCSDSQRAYSSASTALTCSTGWSSPAGFLEWAWQHARHGSVAAPGFLDQVDEHSRLDRMEQALRSCTLWLWLDLRLPEVYGHIEAVLDLRRRLNDGIERHLKAQKPLWQARQRRGARRP
jgi:ATP-dependent RNA helicase SUPV3L1/SUV3